MQWLQVYAAQQSELKNSKQQSTQTLEVLDTAIDQAVEKLQKNLTNDQQTERLEEKHEEVSEYLEEVEQEIQDATNTQAIKEKVQEAKKVVLLKVVSGVTQYEDIEETIPQEVASSQEQIEEAMETIQDSLETSSWDYSIIVQTELPVSKVKKRFHSFDTSTRVSFMYESWGQRVYEVFLEKDSIFRREMLEDIEKGILPESFIGIQIILPEVYSLFSQNSSLQSKNTSSLIEGEDISRTWGIAEYQTYHHFSESSPQKVTVWVVDTGIDYLHPDLRNNTNISRGQDFVNNDDDAYDDQWHGTHVAGVIAASINQEWIIWVNPYAELIPLKICTNRGFCPSYAVLRSLEYATENGIDILNMSLWGRGNPKDHAICNAIESYTKNGWIVVAASGNANIPAEKFIPWGCSESITVWAYDRDKKRAPFSNYGSKVDVSAPWVDIYSTYPKNTWSYRSLSGTSMATPHISGLVSLALTQDKDIGTRDMRKLLQKHSVPLENTSGKSIGGRVDTLSFLEEFQKVVDENETIQNTPLPDLSDQDILPDIPDPQTLFQEETEDSGSSLSDAEIISETTYIDEEIFFIPEQEQADERVRVSNLELEETDGSVPLIQSIAPYTIDLNIFSEHSENQIQNSENPEEEFFELDETGVVDVQLEQNKTLTPYSSQSYNADGEFIDQTQINSTEDAGETVPSLRLEGPIDLDNLPALQPSLDSEQEEDSEDVEQEQDMQEEYGEDPVQEIQELFIDGAESGVDISNFQEQEFTPLQLEQYPEDSETLIFIDEEGNTIDTNQLEEIPLIEEVFDYSYDREVFLDTHSDSLPLEEEGSMVEINSVSDEQLQELVITEHDPHLQIHLEDIQWDPLTGYDDIEIHSSPNPDSLWEENKHSENDEVAAEQEEEDGIIPITPILEQIIIPETQDELFVWDAQDSVEINSLIDEEEWQTIEIEEYRGEEVLEEEIKSDTLIEEEDQIEDSFHQELTQEEYEDIISGKAIIFPTIDQLENEIPTPEDLWEEDEEGMEIHSLGDEVEEFTLWEFTELSEEEMENREWAEDSEESFGIQNTYYCHINAGETCSFSMYKPSRYRFHKTNSLISEHYTSRHVLTIRGLLEGTSTYKMSRYGKYYYTIYVTVTAPKPVVPPKDIYVDVEYGRGLYVDFGTKTNYLYVDGNTLWRIYGSGMNVSGDTRTMTVYRNYTHAYNIHITSVPQEQEISLIEWQRFYKNMYHLQGFTPVIWDEDIITYSTGYQSLYIHAKTAGSTQLKLINESLSQHAYTFNVTVTPAPPPQEYDVTIEEWSKLKLYFPERTYSIEETYNDGARVSIKKRSSSLRIQADFPWNIEYLTRDITGVQQYLVRIHITTKPPVVIQSSVHEWQTISHNLNYPTNNEYSYSSEEHVKLSVDKHRVYITWEKAGNLEIYVKREGIHRYTIQLEVKPSPAPQEHSIRVWEWEQTILRLWDTLSYTVSHLPEWRGKLSVYTWRNKLSRQAKITGTFPWNKTLFLREYPSWIVRHILNVEVVPKPPIVREVTVKQEKLKSLNYKSYDADFSLSASWYISFSKSGSRYQKKSYYVRGLKWWEVELYVKEQGIHRYTYKITVIPKPVPQEYHLNFSWAYGQANISFPESIRRYRFYYQGNTVMYDDIRKYDKSISIEVDRVWEGKIIIRDRDDYDRYIIHVKSEPHYRDYTLYTTERTYNLGVSLRNVNTHIVNKSIARLNKWYLEWLKPGKTELHISSTSRKRSWTIIAIYRIQVLPKPVPKVIECETSTYETCSLEVSNGGYYYNTTFPNNSYDITASNTGLRISSQRSWEFIAYMEWENTSYITHIFKVTFHSRPPKEYECQLTRWWDCHLWSFRTNNRQLTFTTDDPSLFEIRYVRERQSATTTWNKTYNGEEYKQIDGTFSYKIRYTLRAKENGQTQIYIYDDQEHLATIDLNVYKIPSIVLDTTKISTKQSEKGTVNILKGWWDYQKYQDYEDLDYFNPDTNEQTEEQKQEHSYSGDVTMREMTPWRYYPSIRDAYGQTVQITFVVKDTTLKISNYRPTLKTWQTSYLDILESYGTPKIEMSSADKDKLQARIIKQQGSEDLQIELAAQQSWTVNLRVTDQEGNSKVVQLVIEGGDVSEDTQGEEEGRSSSQNPWGESDSGNGDEESTEEESWSAMSFHDLQYGRNNSENWLSSLYFEIHWKQENLQEVWIQYKDTSWTYVRETLEKEEDWIYILWLDKEICINCYNEFQPYFIDTNNTTTYYNTNTYLSFADNGIRTTNTKNKEEEDLAISWVQEYVESTKNKFYNIKKQIRTFKDGNQWYIDGSKQAVRDAIEDLKETPEDILNLLQWSWKILYGYITWERTAEEDWKKAKEWLWALYNQIEEVYNEYEEYKEYLTSYNIQWIEWYVWVSSSLMFVWPGKLKWAKSSERVVKRVRSTWRSWFIASKFKDITWVDDIIKVAQDLEKVDWLDKVKWLEWWAVKVLGDKEGVEGVMKSLETKGWKWEKKPSNKWSVYRYTSPDWKEWITLRDFHSSDTQVRDAGFKHEVTMDLLKWKDWKLQKLRWEGSEIKFLLPNQ